MRFMRDPRRPAMRNEHDRRHTRPADQQTVSCNGMEEHLAERRRNTDRRKENLTLEERQCLFSEMPSPPSADD
jgi:hypothetical protein